MRRTSNLAWLLALAVLLTATSACNNCEGDEYVSFNGAGGLGCPGPNSDSNACVAGDFCVDAEAGTCRVVRSDQEAGCLGEPYHSFNGAGGARCEGPSDSYECLLGDNCIDAAEGLCQ